MLLCEVCRHCVVPHQVRTHLETHHTTLPSSERKSIQQNVLQLPHLGQVVEDVIFPTPDEPPIQNISVQEDCY